MCGLLKGFLQKLFQLRSEDRRIELRPLLGRLVHEEVGNRRQVAAPLRFRTIDHIYVPRIATPSEHLFVINTQKIIAVPELVRQSIRDEAGCVGDILLLPASARHPQHVKRNCFALIDPGDLLRDFRRAPSRQAPHVGETTITTLTLPASALKAVRTAAEVLPTTAYDLSVLRRV